MNPATKPLYLLADSRLLFPEGGNAGLPHCVRAAVGTVRPSAAYFGASNGDDPAFYELFAAAMGGAGITDCRMMRPAFPADDASYVGRADIILLAGGDVRRGWEWLRRNGLAEILRRRYHEGALLMGISAGAVQLGLFGYSAGTAAAHGGLFDTLGLAPFAVGAHEERGGWRALKQALLLAGGNVRGIGIPSGGGLAYHPDGRVEPLRRPLHEFVVTDGQVAGRMLSPRPAQGPDAAPQ